MDGPKRQCVIAKIINDIALLLSPGLGRALSEN